ncbi:MAG: DNA mismatch repair endonuclease MutL [Deltaproteobacteria bacterium]|nr:DNA mismatch repair endonuclease MutL [Deltaproteobacteria bacterium]
MEPRRVIQLPPELANQIAAGEVVARPASVVKELLENSIDAQARTVQVELQSAGVKLVRLVDDGHGMSSADAELALERHATSKLRCAEDLSTIGTLGFRGEALPSIAAVSRFVLRTRRSKDEAGTEVRVDSEGKRAIAPCGCAVGTTVEVADLFHNIPARRKFLRAMATESAHVGEVVRAAALANPEVQIALSRDGRAARSWLRADSRQARVSDVLSDYELAPCSGERGPITIEAYLSRPERGRSGARGLHLFINDRPVQERALARAVASAYGETLERGRFPVGAVFIAMPPELVDVNVHPEKAVVRFAHARAVTDAVYSVLVQQLAAVLDLPTSRSHASGGWRGGAKPSEPADRWQWSGSGQAEPTPRQGEPPPLQVGEPRGAEPLVQDGPAAPGGGPPLPVDQHSLRLVAVLQDRYLLAEHAGGIVVVARRPARAAALRAVLRRASRAGSVPSQRLLFPMVVDTESQVADLVERAGSDLQQLGFDLRRSGPSSVTVHGIPQPLSAGPAVELVTAALAAYEAGDGVFDDERRDRLITTLADATAGAETEPLSTAAASELLATVAFPPAGAQTASPDRSAIVDQSSYAELDRRTNNR